jgi:DNA-binding CsgD family transcriptional regulator
LAIPDAAGLLALGEVAIHAGDEQLTRRCGRLASATLAAGAFDDGRRHVVWLQALQAMARGDASAAREHLRPDESESASVLLPLLARRVGAEVQLVRLAIAAGDEQLADQAVEDATNRAQRNADVPALTASARHARGLRDDHLADLEAAVDGLRGQARPLLLASALEDLAGAHASVGRRGEGVRAFEEALSLYVEAGASWDARRARGKLRALGVRHRSKSPERPVKGWEALTDSEREVGRLVASGLTNAQTGDRLFVSPHTVDTHLRHIFAKLDINSRVQLTRVALQHGQAIER